MAEIPFELVIWNAQQCAEYLGQSYSRFMKKTQYATDFPKRCSIPGHPRWPAQAVAKWALRGIPPESRQPQEESSA